MEKEKIIAVDWSIFLNMATHAATNLSLPATYLAMTMILGNLKKIGVNDNDKIFICCDYLSSWRKSFIKTTKEDRKELREKSNIDWDKIYKDFDELLLKVDLGTDWHVLKLEHLEADDIMSILCKYYKEKEVVLLTMDSDLEQTWFYDNVKIFSPHRKCKRYKIRPKNFDINKVLTKMILTKGHNNLGIPKGTEEYDLKKLCVDLIELPEWIEKTVINKLNTLPIKGEDVEIIPFDKIRNRYLELKTDKSKIITYEECVKKLERKKKKSKKKRRVNNG